MSMSRQKIVSKQSVGTIATRPGSRRNSVLRAGFGSSSVSLLWPNRNSIAFRTEKGGFKVPRYQNTFQLGSSKPFEISVVDKILENVMKTTLADVKTYNSITCLKLCQDMSMEVRKQIFKKDFTRYKYIVAITITEKIGQEYNSGLGFLWDHQRDNYSVYVFENPNFYAIGIVAGVYYE